MMSGNDWWNRNVFSCRRKEETDGADCMISGRVFQKMEAATGNERRPAVDRRYCGTCSYSVNDEWRLDVTFITAGKGPMYTPVSWTLDEQGSCRCSKVIAGVEPSNTHLSTPTLTDCTACSSTQSDNKQQITADRCLMNKSTTWCVQLRRKPVG